VLVEASAISLPSNGQEYSRDAALSQQLLHLRVVDLVFASRTLQNREDDGDYENDDGDDSNSFGDDDVADNDDETGLDTMMAPLRRRQQRARLHQQQQHLPFHQVLEMLCSLITLVNPHPLLLFSISQSIRNVVRSIVCGSTINESEGTPTCPLLIASTAS